MAVNLGSSALVPAGPQGVSGPTFKQQGSFDWVAIGREMDQVPVAILGQLSSAGVDVLTVLVGQAICSKIPIGIHGEKVISHAMSRLKWCKGFGDVLWSGVGVEHILRVLVKTSEDYTQHGYSAQQVENLYYDEISTKLAQDTTSPGLQLRSVVYDSVYLAFWYQLSPQSASQPGEILISPGSFVIHHLADAVRFKSQIRREAESAGPSAGDDIGGTVQVGDLSEEDLGNEKLIDKGLNDHNLNIIAAHGEGSLPSRYWKDNVIIVRPHSGNKLGRCAALTMSPSPVGLLNSAEDLEAFLRVFRTAKAVLGARKGPWTLI